MEKKNGLYFRKANAKPIVVPSYSVETYFAVSQLPTTKVAGLCLPCGQAASDDAFRIGLFA